VVALMHATSKSALVPGTTIAGSGVPLVIGATAPWVPVTVVPTA
jgi:hypothetical protein